MKRTQIYLPEQQLDRLKIIAAQHNTSVSEMIRRFVGEQISTKQQPSRPVIPTYSNAGELLLAIADASEQRGIQAPADLATNMDDYLYGDKS